MAELHLTWLEIPVLDLDRALKFYTAVFELPEVPPYDDGVRRMGIIRNADGTQQGGPGISLNQTADFFPGNRGPLTYFAVGTHANLSAVLDRVMANGGKVVAPLTSMGGGSNYGMFEDSEGNMLAVSSYEPLPESSETTPAAT